MNMRYGIKPKFSGRKEFGGGESWISWWVFDKKTTDDEVKRWCDENDVRLSYFRPGREFALEPVIRRTDGRVLVAQFCWYDI